MFRVKRTRMDRPSLPACFSAPVDLPCFFFFFVYVSSSDSFSKKDLDLLYGSRRPAVFCGYRTMIMMYSGSMSFFS